MRQVHLRPEVAMASCTARHAWRTKRRGTRRRPYLVHSLMPPLDYARIRAPPFLIASFTFMVTYDSVKSFSKRSSQAGVKPSFSYQLQ